MGIKMGGQLKNIQGAGSALSHAGSPMGLSMHGTGTPLKPVGVAFTKNSNQLVIS